MTQDHFQKNNCYVGKTDWNFNIVFDDQPQVAQLAKKYSKALQHPGLYPPVPGKWLHLTILRIGTTSEYSEAEMLAVARKLKPQLAGLKLPEFKLGPWWMYDGMPMLHIAPEGQLEELFNLVMSEVESVVGIKRTPMPKHFVPHVTLAYCRAHNQAKQIYQKLIDNPIEPTTFKVTHIPLLKQRVTDNYYDWEVVTDLPTGTVV
jgi:2'-5' RNA ligase